MAGLKRTDNKGRILKDGESQRKDGTYRYRYTDADGVRRDVYSSRLVPTDRVPPGKKEDLSLREKEKQINRDLGDGIKTRVENKMTVNDLFELYMAGRKDLKETTRTHYFYMYRKYVQEGFGKKKIANVKYSDVKAFYDRLAYDGGLKATSVEVIHRILHPVFALAIRDNYIRTNPTTGVMSEIQKSHRGEKTQRISLTIQEQQAFIRFVSESPVFRRWLPMFTVFLGTGCRGGEILALRWEDCDFDNNLISIHHTLSYGRFEGDDNMRFHISTPKTKKSIREIPMLAEVKAALQIEYEKQRIIGASQVVIDGFSGFVFTNDNGNVFELTSINCVIRRICKKYNQQEENQAAKEKREPQFIRQFSAHNFRHTFCTRLCENVTNLKVIQDIMGHTDIQTTMNIYAEATREKKMEVFTDLEGKIIIS